MLWAHASSIFFVFILINFALIASCYAGSALHPAVLASPKNCIPFAKTQTVQVTRVYDGDTLALSDGRKIRLVGINATEMGRSGKLNQPFALSALKAVNQFVRQSDHMTLLLDTQARDHYGRWLGHIFNDQGESLEQYLLQQGLAYHVAIPPNLKLAECFALVEQHARDNQLGLWGDNGLPPVAAQFVRQGGFHRVQGRVTAVHMGKHWRLVLDDKVSVMIYSEHQHRFSKAWFSHLVGRQLEVQGWLYNAKRQWRIKLETPYGVELLSF